MSENLIINLIYLIIILIVAIPVILLALWRDKKLHEQNPNAMGFKWGYFNGFGLLLFAIVLLLLLVFAMLSGELPEGKVLGFSFLVIVFSLIPGIFILRRHRWAWIFYTVCSVSPILWIINGAYIKNRWNELKEEAAAASRPVPDSEPSNQKNGTSSQQWYFVLNNERYGPVSYDTIRDKFLKGAISRSTPVWREGMSQWIPLAEAPEFGMHTVASAPPPFPPTAFPQVQQPTGDLESLYAAVPWYRRNWFVSLLCILGLFCTSLPLIPACVIVLSGPVYWRRLSADGTRLRSWGWGNKVAAVILILLISAAWFILISSIFWYTGGGSAATIPKNWP